MYFRGTSCCGLYELHGISLHPSTPELALNEALFHNRAVPPAGGIVFTQAGRIAYGVRMAEFIVANGLGTVTRNPPFKNPNTRRQIHTFVWDVNRVALETYYREKVLPNRIISRY